MEISFPLEFIVYGTAVSHQAKRNDAKEQWKAKIQEAARQSLGGARYASEGRITVCLYYFPSEAMAGDVDNIAKLVLDACAGPVFVDDRQVERLVVQKFDPDKVFKFSNPSQTLARALDGEKPALYIKVSDNPWEDLA